MKLPFKNLTPDQYNKPIEFAIHNSKHLWRKYILPKRLTLKTNPPIYRWLWWVWSPSKDVQ